MMIPYLINRNGLAVCGDKDWREGYGAVCGDKDWREGFRLGDTDYKVTRACVFTGAIKFIQNDIII